MRRALGRMYRTGVLLGFDPRATVRTLRGLPAYRRALRELKRQRETAGGAFPFGVPRPCLGEGEADSGLASGHYFHQDLLVARRVFESRPVRHVDVGSRIDGFVAHVASFRPIEVFDIRPMPNRIPNVTFVQADMMTTVPDELTEYCDSLSCLHALEHFGLGRYGDPLDYLGHERGLDNLHRIVKTDGTLHLSVPIGPQRIEFNAHRVFSMAYLLELLAGRFCIERFSFVDDRGDLHEDVPMTDNEISTNFGCVYGCGIFEMTKL